MKKVLREIQTLHAGCSTVEPKIFRPTANPLPGGAGWPKFHQLEMVTTFTYKPCLVRIDARNFELSRPTNTHTLSNIQDQLQYTAPQLERSVTIWNAKQIPV